MDSVRQYLLSIICVSVIVAVITSIQGEKKALSGIIKLIAGVFIIFTAIAPAVKVEFEDFQNFYRGISSDAQSVVQQGEMMSQQSAETIIKEQLEAYILDKASSLGLNMDVELTLKDAFPEEITIRGNASPYGKKMLQTFIVEEIGIAVEKQIWN